MEESIHHNSSHFAAISDASPVQAPVIEALAAEVNDGIHELAAHALLTLHDLLRDPATPHAIRLKTALAILQRPHAPNPGWNLPGPVESEPAETNRGATPITAATEPATLPTQPSAPAPIARCAPCPCGSGRKYKRCCGAKAIGSPVTPNANPRAALKASPRVTIMIIGMKRIAIIMDLTLNYQLAP